MNADKNEQLLDNPPLKSKEEFKAPLTPHSFIRCKSYLVILGNLDEMIRLKHKQNTKFYLLKIIKKSFLESIDGIQTLIDSIYKISSEYSIELIGHWSDSKNIYLVIKDIEKFIKLEEVIKTTIDDNQLLEYYYQILQSVTELHENKIYGCLLHLSSFIFDLNDKKIKLTDIGFSKILPKRKIANPFKLDNDFYFNIYDSREYLLANSGKKQKEPFVFNEKSDVWQLGILFFKLASSNNVPFNYENSNEVFQAITNGDICYEKINHRSKFIIDLIQSMLVKNEEKRATLSSINQKVIIQLKNLKKINDMNDNDISSITPTINDEIKKIFPYIQNDKEINTINNNENINIDESSSNHVYTINEIFNKMIQERDKIDEAKEEINKMCCNIEKIANDVYEYEINKNEELINLFKNLDYSKDTIEQYENILKENKNITFNEYQDIIRHFVYETKRLKINLDIEKSKNLKLIKDKIEMEKLKNELQNKINTLNTKIKVLETIKIDNVLNNNLSDSNLRSESTNSLNETFQSESGDIMKKGNDNLENKNSNGDK